MVIPTHNRSESLLRLLNSFNFQRELPDEIIVVNDGSRDNTEEVLKEWESNRYKFIPIVFNNPHSQGPGMARNIGIELASSDVIAFTDDDCIVLRLWIKEIKNSKIWNQGENIAGIGGKVIPYRNGFLSQYYTFHRILEPPRYNQYLVTANACYKKQLLIDVKGFDTSHKYPGGEDNALSFKLITEGYKFGYEKRMVVVHDYRTSIPSFIKTFFRYGKGSAETTYKYFNGISIEKLANIVK